MSKDKYTFTFNKKEYTAAFNKDEDTISVTYKRGVVAKSKKGWLGMFVGCVGMGIIDVVVMVAAWCDNQSGWVTFFAISAIVFFLVGLVFIRQFALFRRLLREFEKSMSEKRE